MDKNFEIINIFWTGGWDSTFRLLQVLLIEGKTVQPYYILDFGRSSLATERQRMDLIREKVVRKFPNVEDRFLSTRFFHCQDIKTNQRISESYQSIAGRIHLGTQFEWLARFCCEHGLSKMELCIESGGTNRINQELIEKFQQNSFELDDRFSHTDIYEVFQYFTFPLIHTTKRDMYHIACKNDFADLMNLTWFCHTPVNGRPCGVCNPCRSVIHDGLGYRIPIFGHMRKIFWNFIFCLKSALRRFPMFYQFLKAVKGNFRCH